MPALHKLITDRNDEEKQAENRKTITEKLLFWENEGFRKLSYGPFFMGRDITLVDLQYMPFIERFPCYEELWSAKIPDECTRIRDWISVMQDRESHKQTVNTIEFHMERYRRYEKAA